MIVDTNTVVNPGTMAKSPQSAHENISQKSRGITHWSCLATQRWHLLQCLLLKGVLIMH